MKYLKKKPGILKSFARDDRGAHIIVYGLMFFPMMAMAMLAVDYNNAERIKTEMDTATEAVALHTAKRIALNPNMDPDDLAEESKAMLRDMTSGLDVEFDTFNVDSLTGRVKIAAYTDVPTFFAKSVNSLAPLRGSDAQAPTELRVYAKNEARFGRNDVEVAIAIDNSGSMNTGSGSMDLSKCNMGSGTSYVTRMVAAKCASRILIEAAAGATDQGNVTLKYSVIPWTGTVRVPHSEMRTGASESAMVDQGTWADWIDWDGRSSTHFNYLAPYKKNQGDMYFSFTNTGCSDGDCDEYRYYDPAKLIDFLPKESDGNGIDLNTLKSYPNIGVVSRKDVYQTVGAKFNGCFELRTGKYMLNFAAPTTATAADPALDAAFDGDSLYVPLMAPDERDGSFYRNDYLVDTGGRSDHTHARGGDNSDDYQLDNYENARVYNSAKYDSPQNWHRKSGALNYGGGAITMHVPFGPNGNCVNPNVILPLNDDVDGIVNNQPDGALADAIDSMVAMGSTDLTNGLVWGMNTLTPWAPFEQAGEFLETQKVMVFMTDGENSLNSSGSWANNFTTLQYMRDDLLDEFSGIPDSDDARELYDELSIEYCKAIKARGVKLYYVFFGDETTDAEKIRKACASSPDASISASNSTELANAFKKIGEDIGKLRLVHYNSDE